MTDIHITKMSLKRFIKILNSGIKPFHRTLYFTRRQNLLIQQMERESGRKLEQHIGDLVNIHNERDIF